jgi:hypothetical protein
LFASATPARKRQLIDTRHGDMIEIARAGKEALQEAERILRK